MVKQTFTSPDGPISFIMVSETEGIPTSYLTSFCERLLLSHESLDFTLPSDIKAYVALQILIIDVYEYIDNAPLPMIA